MSLTGPSDVTVDDVVAAGSRIGHAVADADLAVSYPV